ncbi:hypothetical protein L9F63_022324, partial [Diploptera punctata]
DHAAQCTAMTSRVAMDTMRPDERAAGVISGSDPYRELELYLEKVNIVLKFLWTGCTTRRSKYFCFINEVD